MNKFAKDARSCKTQTELSGDRHNQHTWFDQALNVTNNHLYVKVLHSSFVIIPCIVCLLKQVAYALLNLILQHIK